MLRHLSRAEEHPVCKVCGRELRAGEQSHQVTGLGTVCGRCGLQSVECESCGRATKRITVTVLRGRSLCLNCYAAERKAGEKRRFKTIVSDDYESLIKIALAMAPEGFRFIGLRIKPSSKNTWQAEYEREDIFEMRCS